MRINEIITEGVNDTFLYHGMDYAKAINVFYGDSMEARFKQIFPQNTKDKTLHKEKHPSYWEKVSGNSFTRNKNLKWAPIILTVDRIKLAQTNKIVPIDGWKMNDLRNQTAMFRGGMTNPLSAKPIPSGRAMDRHGNERITDYYKFDSDRQRLDPKDEAQPKLMEEFVIGDIKQIHRCIVKIEVIEPKWDNADKGREADPLTYDKLDRIIRMINAYSSRYNIPFTINNVQTS